ncbi:MAG: hypothetical protein KJO35_01635, partial [Gammaproteobacteria bacterium]|nr:hypothetical protein [Gammaproteobacteria bacterium]
YAIFLFVISSATLVLVSLKAPPPDTDKLRNLTVTTLAPTPRGAGEEIDHARWRRQDATWSVLVLLIIAAVWLYFT